MTFEWSCMGLSVPLDVVPPGPGSHWITSRQKHSVSVTLALTRSTYWSDSQPHTTLWYSGPKLISRFKKTLGVFHSDGVYLHVGMKYGEVRRRKGLYMCMCVREREKCLRERRLWGSECLQFFTGECLRANKSLSYQEVDNSEAGNTNTAFNMLNVCHITAMKTDICTNKTISLVDT